MPSPVTRRAHPFLLASLVGFMVFAWSLNFIFGKIGLRHMGVLTLASFRIVIAGLLIGFLYLFKPNRPRFRLRDYWIFIELGFFGVIVNSGLFTVGLKYTTASHSSVIIAMGPILVLVLARLLRLEALTATKILGLALAFVGVAILATEQGIHIHSATLLGDGITFTCAIGFAIYTVLGKRVAAQYDSFSMNTYNMLASAVLISPLAIHQAMRLDWSSVGWAGWFALVYMAVMGSVVGYLIYYWALQQMPASRIATVSYMQPVLATLLGILFLGERLTHQLLFGGALVLVGVYLTGRGSFASGAVRNGTP